MRTKWTSLAVDRRVDINPSILIKYKLIISQYFRFAFSRNSQDIKHTHTFHIYNNNNQMNNEWQKKNSLYKTCALKQFEEEKKKKIYK